MPGPWHSLGILAGAALAAAGALLGLDLIHGSDHAHHSAWANPLAYWAYAAVTIGVIALCLAAHCASSAFHATDRPGWIIVADSPDDLKPDSIGNGFRRERIRDILQRFKYNTPEEARRILRPYVGRWIRITGVVHYPGPWNADHAKVEIRSGSRHPNLVMKFCYMPTYDRDVAGLRRGRRVTVIGRIEDIGPRLVTTADSQIVLFH